MKGVELPLLNETEVCLDPVFGENEETVCSLVSRSRPFPRILVWAQDEVLCHTRRALTSVIPPTEMR